MKKLKCISIVILLFFITYFLQMNFFTWFNIAGIMPNLFVTLILFIGLFIGQKFGVVFGLFFGLFLDIMIGKNTFFTGIVLAIVGLIGECFDKSFSKDNKLMIILLNVMCTMVFEIIIYALNIIIFKTDIEVRQFIINLLIECIFNSFILIIFYGGMKKLGYYLEENFKGKTFLTRYF